jgi:hypothetical protein
MAHGVLGCVAAVALALAGCGADSEQRTLFVLLTDNHLLRVSENGEVKTRVRLGAAPGMHPSYGGLLAASPDRETVYALVRGKQQKVAAIAVDGTVLPSFPLPRDVTWRRLAIGPKSGRLYVAGNVPGTRRNDLGDIELGVRLFVLSPDGERLADETIREPGGLDWHVAHLTVAEDESSVLVSYHGSDTTGADLVRLRPIRPCKDRTPAWGACLTRNHGRAQWLGDRVLAATGEPELAMLTPSGRLVRTLATGLENVHLMEFVVAGDALYAFGNCVQGAGLARVPLSRGSPRVLAPDACGDTAAVLDNSTLVLGRRANDDPYDMGVGHDPALVFVALQAPRIEKSVRLPHDPADVLAVR